MFEHKALDDFQDTVNRLRGNLLKIDSCYNFSDLSKYEIETVRVLQLLEAQVGELGRELYDIVRKKRVDLQMGCNFQQKPVEETNEDSKRSDTGRTKRQPNRKTKRASR